MKSYLIPIFTLALFARSVSAQDKPDLTDHNQKINYALGADMISTFQQQDVTIDARALIAGMKDALAGNPILTPEQQQAALKEFQAEMMAKAQAKWKVLAVQNLNDGQDFLAANAKKPGALVKELAAADGSKTELQYRVIKSGPAGPSPQKTDIVEVHYVGSTIDGSVFDSSVKRNTPATFGLDTVIPGWAAALQMMKVGDKWELFIPANLSYGEFPPPGIGPNSVLIFEIELLSFYTPAPNTNTPPVIVK